MLVAGTKKALLSLDHTENTMQLITSIISDLWHLEIHHQDLTITSSSLFPLVLSEIGTLYQKKKARHTVTFVSWQ